MIWTKRFWKLTAEHVIRTAATAALAALSVDQLLHEVDLEVVAGLTGTAALIALLTSLAGSRVAEPDTPTLVHTQR